MKRDRRLQDLSHDHHRALVLARRAINTSASGHSMACEEVWREIVRCFECDLSPHFAIEERFLLPALAAVGELPEVEQICGEHNELRQIARRRARSIDAQLADFGLALRAHVQFEERTRFPVVEAKLERESLGALAAACRRRRD